MIDAIKQFRKNVEQWQRSLPDVVLESVKENEGQIIDLNTEEQLMKGLDSDGQAITPGYTPFTVSIKRQKGQPTDRVTLKDEGDFHRSFKIAYGNDAFAIYADDPKAQKLERKYGNEIFGLTDDNLQETIEITKDDLAEKSHKIIFTNLG